MTRAQKIGLGAFTVWPVLYLLTMLILARAVDLKAVVGLSPPPGGLPAWFVLHLGVHVITILTGVAVTTFYLWHVYRGGRVPRNSRLPWAIFLALGSLVAIAPFFWLYVWPDEAEP